MARKHIPFDERYIQEHPEYVQEEPKYVRRSTFTFYAKKDMHNLPLDFDSIYTAFCENVPGDLFPKNRIYAIVVNEKRLRAVKKGQLTSLDLILYDHPWRDLDTLNGEYHRIEGDELIVIKTLKDIPKEYQRTGPPIATPIFKRIPSPKLIWKKE